MTPSMFSGSYDIEDVCFLLKPVSMAPTPVEEKERLIQSGEQHYSEVIAPESPPDKDYIDLFHAAFRRNRQRFAEDVVTLATGIASSISNPTIVSLARAGTPVGALLRRCMKRMQIDAPHYSISIIRDRGLDFNALDAIVEKHPEQSLVFVDGWTGKGAIRNELTRSLGDYNQGRTLAVPDRLAVISDLAGCADLACNTDDYLIPNAILNAVISGLVSRTILNQDVVGPKDFHACVFYADWAQFDLSNWFLDAVSADIDRLLSSEFTPPPLYQRDERPSRLASQSLIETMMNRYQLRDENRVKPGIGEATRASMRRVPERVIVRELDSPDTAHLLHLAERRSVLVEHQPDLPVGAVTIIKSLGKS